ncbi:MAG: hypothetical protein JNL38_23415 [Myxococcales bacterium]|nr:hypothetical protein [Myxococcales bacterium]
MTRRRCATILVALLAFAAPRAAEASDPASAQMLFDQARKLMNEEKWAEACPKLEESQRLDPAGGTLLHLAVCREHEGKTATAWALYQDALSVAKRDGRKDRAKVAQERIDALGPTLPRIKLRVASATAALPKLTVSRNDVEIGRVLWDEAFPVDPGKLTLVARAPGKKPFTKIVDVPNKPGEIVVEVPALEGDSGGSASATPHEGSGDAGHAAPTEAGSTQRTIAYAVGGAGIVGVAVGSVFGVMSMTNRSTVESECRAPEYKLCSAAGVDAGESAIRNGNVSTVAFIAGGVLLAGGVALYFTAPKGNVAVTPAIGPGAASLGVSARF